MLAFCPMARDIEHLIISPMSLERPLVIGFLSQAWTLYCIPQLSGVVEYVNTQPSLSLRDLRYMTNPQTPDQLERGKPPWTGLVDGVITSEGVERDAKETADWMLRGNVPVVNLGADVVDPRIPIVHTSFDSVGQLAANHFLDMGIRHFAVIGFVLSHASQLRRDAFIRTLAGHGQTAAAHDLSTHVEGINDDATILHREAGLIKLLQTIQKPVGILTVNDGVARALCQLVTDLGLRVPEDVAVLGVGNSDICSSSSISLSSVRTPGELIGYTAARTLHQILQGTRPPAHAQQIPAIEVIARQSTLGRAPRLAELDRAIEFIQRHAASGIDVEQVMQTITMSRRRFEQLFSAKMGHSPGTEIRRLRFERAKSLLLQTDLTIARISQMIGFAETAAFSKFFKKHAQIAPATFRAQNQMPAKP